MASNQILENESKFNESIDRILETMSNLNIMHYTEDYEADRFDKFLDATTKIENKVLDNKYVKSIDSTANDILEDIGVYGMMFSIPLGIFAFVTGGVGTLLLTPIMFGTCFAIKKYAQRKNSIIKKTSYFTKKQLLKLKYKIKQMSRAKTAQKNIDKLRFKSENSKTKDKKQKVSIQLSAQRQLSYLNDKVQETITEFSNAYTNIANKAKTQEQARVDSNTKYLQMHGIDTILHLKVKINELQTIKKTTDTLNTQIDSTITQCNHAIDTIKENVQITDDMIYNRYQYILKSSQQEDTPSK